MTALLIIIIPTLIDLFKKKNFLKTFSMRSKLAYIIILTALHVVIYHDIIAGQ